MMNQAGSSRMDTVLKMMLIAFISLLAFSSGVYFGKQLSDSDYQLKALESDFNGARGTASASGEQGPEDAINQEDAAALADKLVSGEKADLAKEDEHGDDHGGDGHGDKQAVAHDSGHGGKADARKVASTDDHGHGATVPTHAVDTAAHDEKDEHDDHAHAPVAKGAKPAAHGPAQGAKDEDHADVHAPAAKADPHGRPVHEASVQKPDLSAAAKAAQRVANNASPTEHGEVTHETRVPTSLPKTVGISQDVEFTVQVASYPTPEAAKEHADELVKKGFPAFPVEANVSGKVWYRVSVGSFKTLREATIYRGQLVKQTTVPSAIVQRIRR